ncbi:MAG: DUF6141 family protein [Dehalococcoidia bacterium]
MSQTNTDREVQRFRQPFLWVIVGGITLLFWFLFIQALVSDEGSVAGFIVPWLIFGVGFPVMFGALALTTTVSRDGLELRFWPFPGRRIPWEQVAGAQAIIYRPLAEFGGWGLRWGFGGRRAYTVSGNRGVELTLTNGRRIVIGSRDPDRLCRAMAPYLHADDSSPRHQDAKP